jgi:hypothetical protein
MRSGDRPGLQSLTSEQAGRVLKDIAVPAGRHSSVFGRVWASLCNQNATARAHCIDYPISVDVQYNRVTHSTMRDDACVRIRIFSPDKPVQTFRRFVSKAVPARRTQPYRSFLRCSRPRTTQPYRSFLRCSRPRSPLRYSGSAIDR